MPGGFPASDAPVLQTALGWPCWPGTGLGHTMLFLHILGVALFVIQSPVSGSYRTSYRMEVVMDLLAVPPAKAQPTLNGSAPEESMFEGKPQALLTLRAKEPGARWFPREGNMSAQFRLRLLQVMVTEVPGNLRALKMTSNMVDLG